MPINTEILADEAEMDITLERIAEEITEAHGKEVADYYLRLREAMKHLPLIFKEVVVQDYDEMNARLNMLTLVLVETVMAGMYSVSTDKRDDSPAEIINQILMAGFVRGVMKTTSEAMLGSRKMFGVVNQKTRENAPDLLGELLKRGG